MIQLRGRGELNIVIGGLVCFGILLAGILLVALAPQKPGVVCSLTATGEIIGDRQASDCKPADRAASPLPR